MDDPRAVQPIDEYVQTLLGLASREFGLTIDPKMATRGQRLEAALAFHNAGQKDYPLDIMNGRRLSSEPSGIFEYTRQHLAEQRELDEILGRDPADFYASILHNYNPL